MKKFTHTHAEWQMVKVGKGRIAGWNITKGFTDSITGSPEKWGLVSIKETDRSRLEREIKRVHGPHNYVWAEGISMDDHLVAM